MTIKDIYFIRHGQTVKNTKHVHQHYDEPLSEAGQIQVEKLAQYVHCLKIETLVTSPFTRARQTAEEMSGEINIPYTIDTSVHEVIRPLYLYGKNHYSWATFKYIFNLFIHHNSDTWNDDGAENMFDVRNRVHDAKDMIMETEENVIAVVSHAVFIDLFVNLVCAEKKLSIWSFIKMLIFVKKMPNTSVVHMQYNPDAHEGVCQWQFVKVIKPEEF